MTGVGFPLHAEEHSAVKLAISAVADYASTSDGKLNIMGIFDGIRVPELPVRHPALYLALRFRGEYEDEGVGRRVDVTFEDPDGNRLLALQANVLRTGRAQPGDVAHVNQIFVVRDIIFGTEGTYMFRIWIDGVMVGEHPIRLIVAAPGAETKAGGQAS
jgi:hypothetical protein